MYEDTVQIVSSPGDVLTVVRCRELLFEQPVIVIPDDMIIFGTAAVELCCQNITEPVLDRAFQSVPVLFVQPAALKLRDQIPHGFRTQGQIRTSVRIAVACLDQ